MTTPKIISTEEFDRRFDDGEDISDYIDWSTAHRPGMDPEGVKIDIPGWLALRLDTQAEKRGMSRQTLVMTWLSDQLDKADQISS